MKTKIQIAGILKAVRHTVFSWLDSLCDNPGLKTSSSRNAMGLQPCPVKAQRQR